MAGSDSPVHLRGIALLPADFELKSGALTVSVLDVSEIDARAVTVAHVRLVFSDPQELAQRRLPFVIPLPEGLPRDSDYSLQAKYIVSGNDGLAKGDLVSTVAQPVNVNRHEIIEVMLKQV